MKVGQRAFITGKILSLGYLDDGCYGNQKHSHSSFIPIIVMNLWWEGWGWLQKGPKAIGFHGNLFAAMATKNCDF